MERGAIGERVEKLEGKETGRESFLRMFFNFCSAVAWTTKCVNICNIAYMCGKITYIFLTHQLRNKMINPL